ncbi:hypothetical protein ACFL08_04690 [Patescibacteria group bacterium]
MKDQVHILIIEDKQNHLENARLTSQEIAGSDLLRIADIQISVDFATNYVEAIELMSANCYDGIVSDIFFPYSNEREWDEEIKNKCFSELEKYYLGFIKTQAFNYVHAMHNWMERSSLHPTGLVIAIEAVNRNIPFIFCSDTYHHGLCTQPVCDWGRERKMAEIVDSEGLEKEDLELPFEEALFIERSLTKNWDRALTEVLAMISEKVRIIQELKNKSFLDQDNDAGLMLVSMEKIRLLTQRLQDLNVTENFDEVIRKKLLNHIKRIENLASIKKFADAIRITKKELELL